VRVLAAYQLTCRRVAGAIACMQYGTFCAADGIAYCLNSSSRVLKCTAGQIPEWLFAKTPPGAPVGGAVIECAPKRLLCAFSEPDADFTHWLCLTVLVAIDTAGGRPSGAVAGHGRVFWCRLAGL
jgi:hypothetical protein